MLTRVLLSSDVALVCVQHALSSEKEEIMGLLIGEVNEAETVVSISSSMILRRLDKKPDRVEISEEQLVQATLRAEELAEQVGRSLRVVGWYHSHPHITVWPSHVDLRTQAMYQNMAPSFVGLIFAVYIADQGIKAPCVQITCFQSNSDNSGSPNRKEIRLKIVNNPNAMFKHSYQTLTQLPTILKEEEDESYNNLVGTSDKNDVLVNQHNAAVRTIAVGHIVEKMSRPMLETLVANNKLSTIRLESLKRLRKELFAKYT